MAIATDMLGISLAKQFSISNNPQYMWAIAFTYLLVGVFFALTVKHAPSLAIANTLWVIFALIFGFLISLLFFKEQLNMFQWAGIIICIVGVIIMQIPSSQ